MTRKRPHEKEKASSRKRPVEKVNADSYLNHNPIWRFYKSDDSHDKWGLKSNCNFNEELLDRLEDLESMTWSDIKIGAKKENHFINISELCREAQKRITDDLKLDVDQLFSIRVTGRKRLWGILEQGVFSIIWYDPNHEVCPSLKKHT